MGEVPFLAGFVMSVKATRPLVPAPETALFCACSSSSLVMIASSEAFSRKRPVSHTLVSGMSSPRRALYWFLRASIKASKRVS